MTPVSNQYFKLINALIGRKPSAPEGRGKKNFCPNTVFATGAVQEEITLSGATTVVEAVKPDIAITLDIDLTSDLPANSSANYAQSALGKGVVFIYTPLKCCRM